MHVLVARLRLNLFNDDGDGSVHIFFIPYVILQVYLNFIPSRDSFQKIVSTLLQVRLFASQIAMFVFFAVCPDGSRPVNCFANPCDVSNGCYNIPMASCRYDIISFFTSVLKRYENKQLNCKVSHLALIMLSI